MTSAPSTAGASWSVTSSSGANPSARPSTMIVTVVAFAGWFMRGSLQRSPVPTTSGVFSRPDRARGADRSNHAFALHLRHRLGSQTQPVAQHLVRVLAEHGG